VKLVEGDQMSEEQVRAFMCVKVDEASSPCSEPAEL
jgi:hypothetical protein